MLAVESKLQGKAFGTALEGTPESYRSFEWRHLRHALDDSIATFDAADEPCAVQALAFSADESRLFVGTSNAGLRVIEVGAEARVASPAGFVGESVSVPALGPRAEMLIGAGPEGTLSIRRTDPGGEVLSRSVVPGDALECAAISADGRRVAGWTDHSNFELFDVSGTEWRSVGRWEGVRHWRSSIAFSADGSLLAFGVGGGNVRIVDARSGAERALLGEAMLAGPLSFSPDGQRLALGYGPDVASSDGGVSVYDVAAGTLERRFPFDIGPVYGLAFATVLTLVVTPAALMAFTRSNESKASGGWLRRLFRRRKAADASVEAEVKDAPDVPALPYPKAAE